MYGSDNKTVRVWGHNEGNWSGGHCLTGHTHSIHCLAISGDGKVVVSVSYDKTVSV